MFDYVTLTLITRLYECKLPKETFILHHVKLRFQCSGYLCITFITRFILSNQANFKKQHPVIASLCTLILRVFNWLVF